MRQYLSEYSHPQLSIEMLEQDALIVDDPDRPGTIVFDVRKTRGALGARYRPDRPLAAVETYWVRYCYDREQNSLSQIGTNVDESQESKIAINSVPRLLSDYCQSVLGLVDRAWP